MTELDTKLKQIKEAYEQLFSGASTLLDLNALHWREKWLLRLVQVLYKKRLEETQRLIPHGGK